MYFIYKIIIATKICLNCSGGAFLDKIINKCVQNCSKGYYKDYDLIVCMKCKLNCASCLSLNYCLEWLNII